MVAAFFFALSNLLFWWIGKHSCTSYIETWMGLTPMEVRIAYHSGGQVVAVQPDCGGTMVAQPAGCCCLQWCCLAEHPAEAPPSCCTLRLRTRPVA